jgi:two-component system, NarL family, response regulator DesR
VIRVVVVEDTPLFRGALTSLLRREEDIDVVAEASRWTEVFPAVRGTGPDIVVIGLDPSGRDALSDAVEVCQAAPGTRALMLLEAHRHDILARARKPAFRTVGFLTKKASPDRLVSAVRSLAAGTPVIDPELVVSALTAPANPLTDREHHVLRLAAEGAPVKEIANTLFLSAGTVRNCLSRINTKTGASNRIQAIRRAQQAGWL